MDVKHETKRRFDIAQDITNQIKDYTKAIVLGGSMGYGMNYSVRVESDIDLVVIVDKSQLGSLLQKGYFEEFNLSEPFELVKEGQAGFFWVTKIINSVEVNMYIYETKAYTDYCLFKKKIVGYKKEAVKTTGKGYVY